MDPHRAVHRGRGDLCCRQCCSAFHVLVKHSPNGPSRQKGKPKTLHTSGLAWGVNSWGIRLTQPLLDFLSASGWFTDGHLKKKPLLGIESLFFFFSEANVSEAVKMWRVISIKLSLRWLRWHFSVPVNICRLCTVFSYTGSYVITVMAFVSLKTSTNF